MRKTNYSVCLFITTIGAAVFFVYFPGIHGPFVFDDYGNIINNAFLRIQKLDLESLYYSSFSGSAGPLRRPVAMLSFALNYYFSDGTNHAFAYKLTNITIHGLSAGILLVVIKQLFSRYGEIASQLGQKVNTNPLYFALAITLIWSLHPINVTSVLYVVQRMTSLSGLFSLASLSLYLYARNTLIHHSLNTKSFFALTGSTLCFLLALLSKENALLLPLFILSIELSLYSNTAPWSYIHSLSAGQKKVFWTSILVCSLAFLVFCIHHALPGYSGRHFTMMERVFTEARVLCLYLSLILIPRINAFGLFHDDLSISSSLLGPPTTLLSICLLIGLLIVAYKIRQRHPLATLGILWFFVGHLLESTLFPLEIAHEHRNYLPSIGIILAVGALCWRYFEQRPNRLLLITCVISLIVGGTTWLRANQWQDIHHLAEYEALHSPNSSATLTLLARSLYMRGDLQGSANATLRASELDPKEPMYLLNLKLLENDGIAIPEDTHQKIIHLLSNKYPSAASQMALDRITSCVDKKHCSGLRDNLLEWLDAIIQAHSKTPQSAVYFHHLRGRALESGEQYLGALNAYQKAYDGNPKFLHPLIEMVDILLRMNNIEQAERVFSWLETANQDNAHPQDEAVEKLRQILAELKTAKSQKQSQDQP